MALLLLKSTNPKFSFVINKNPCTQLEKGVPFDRDLRKGKLYGWFNRAADQFTMWFRDHPTECSFSSGVNADFEYLDQSRYSSPLFPASAISSMLSDTLKKAQPDDVEGFENSITVPTLYVPNLKALHRSFRPLQDRFKLETEQLHGRNYSVTVTTTETIQKLLCVMALLSLQQTVFDKDTYLHMPTELILKYVRALNVIDAPFYLRYTFAKFLFQDRNTFNKNRSLINGEGMNLQYGNTRAQRFDFIKSELTGGSSLIDIGCGELWQAAKLCSKYEMVQALDADPEVQEANEGRIKKRQIVNINLGGKIQDTDIIQNIEVEDILATEVLEHMPLEEAEDLLSLLAKTNFRKLVITVPNRDFNKYYGMESGEFRHPDHKWEPSVEEMGALINKHFSEGYSVKPYMIGDSVKEETSITSTSIGFVIEKAK